MKEYIVSEDSYEYEMRRYGELKELIRCKDCKHWDGNFCHNKWWGDGYGNYTPPIKKEGGYCDWSKRKEQ